VGIVVVSGKMNSGAVVFAILLLSTLVAGDAFNCSADVVSEENGKKYRYNLTALYHEPQLSDILYFRDSQGGLTYINLCGDTTTVCSPASPVCKRSGLWSTMGYGDLETQVFKPIELEGVKPGQGVTVEYTHGEFCPRSEGTSSKIHVVCGNEEAVTSVTLSNDGCTLSVVINSAAGCGEEVAVSVPAVKVMAPIIGIIGAIIVINQFLYFYC